MRLWSIQPIEVWNELQTKGYYRCEPSKACFIYDEKSNFRDQYIWLVKQMKQCIGDPPQGVYYPVWAWYIFDSKNKKPDLRQCGYREPGEQSVCIEFEIPKEKVLLSDFDGWHLVLGNSYYIRGGSAEESDSIDIWLDSLSEEERNKETEVSWQGIFNNPVESDWCPVGQYVQATFWELRMDQVIKVQFFKAR